MVRRNATVEIEDIEKPALIARLADPSWQTAFAENRKQTESRVANDHEHFSTLSVITGKAQNEQMFSAFAPKADIASYENSA